MVDEPTRSGGLFICLPRASLPATPVAGFKCGRLICCMSYNVTTGVRHSSNVRLSYRIQQMRQQLRGSIPICIMADLSAARARGRVGGRPPVGSTRLFAAPSWSDLQTPTIGPGRGGRGRARGTSCRR